VSRVSVHWSSKGDGVYDQHRVFADKLLLPRLLLPLADGGVLIGETDTNDIWLYTDTNGDGVSDNKKRVYEGGPAGGNLEHQRSGLIWTLDNWIYFAQSDYRLRWHNGELIKQKIPGNQGQWGATQDDQGKVWVVNAGGEKGPINFQQHPLYGRHMMPGEFEPGFEIVWPAMGLRDFQGGPGKARDDDTLNHFTGTCGGEIFRGDQLPAEMKGNLFFGEPVGRLVRRTQIEVADGITVLHNPYPQNEFLRSTDACFRPVDMKTAPDGTLFICDMYRGIIQEGAWVTKGGYLRKVIEQHAMEKITDRGRIWRLVHDTTKPVAQPQLLNASGSELVAALAHPNGWWRDTAQKILVVKQDQGVIPDLNKLLVNANPLARMHALWTLEGLGALKAEHVRTALKDKDPKVRHTAIRAAEVLIIAGDASLIGDVKALSGDKDPSVAIQALLTMKLLNGKDVDKFINTAALTNPSKGVKTMAAQILTKQQEWAKSFNTDEKALLTHGQTIYQELCYTCHGLDGKGTSIEAPNGSFTLAPPLGGDRVVLAQRDAAIRAVLHGVTGPVRGKTYQGQMIPMANNDDAWIAAVISYVRNSFGNSAAVISKDDVARVRKEAAGRTLPWTEDELLASGLPVLTNRKEWKLTASHNPEKLINLIENKAAWETKDNFNDKMWISIELPQETQLSGINIRANASWEKRREVRIETSTDGAKWKEVVRTDGSRNISDLRFAPTTARFIRIKPASGDDKKPWTVHEINLLGVKA
jgi:mono/diheme cytochrome c family protein